MELCELTNPRCKKSVRFNLSYIIASIALQIDHEVELQWNADKKWPAWFVNNQRLIAGRS